MNTQIQDVPLMLMLLAPRQTSRRPSCRAIRSTAGRRIQLGVWIVLCILAFAAAGCVVPPPPEHPACPTSGGQTVTILPLATSTDLAPSLTRDAEAVLRAAAESEDATDEPGGRGSTAEIVVGDGQYLPVLSLTPRRDDCSVEHGAARPGLIEANLAGVRTTVASVASVEPGLDILQAIDNAVRGRPPGTLIVIGHGLGTRGALDVSAIGFDDNPADLVAQLRAAEQLPAVRGWTVIWVGLGAVSGAQADEAGSPVLPKALRARLRSYYEAIFTASGADSTVFDDSPLAPTPPNGHAAMPIIEVPEIRSVPGSEGRTTTIVPNDLLGFAGDSAELPASAGEVLDPLVDVIKDKVGPHADLPVIITAYVADAPGPTDGQALSQARAEACKAYLIAAGIRNPIAAIGGGVPPGETAFRDGRFSEAAAATMRRAHIEY